MIFENSYDYNDDYWVEKIIMENEIIENIEKYHIDIEQLKLSYNNHIVSCWDEEVKKLFVFILEENKFSSMRIFSPCDKI